MIKYFIKTLEKVSKQEEIPYYLQSKVKDLFSALNIEDKSNILHYIIRNENAGECFRYLNKNKVLFYIFYYLDILKRVPQKKGHSKNAFDHTLNVLDLVPIDNIDLRWVALLHDLGKFDSYFSDNNFHNHQEYSYKLALDLCDIYKVQNKEKICNIIKYHMIPLDYQRQPNWTDKAIINFIEKCGKENIFDIIEFAFYDKKAENDIKEYLDIIIELRNRVSNILGKV